MGIDDIEMIVRYRYEPHELLETPIVCFRGSEDNTHEPDTVHMWKNVTVEDTSVFVVPGDHFFLHNKVAKDLIFSIIMEYVEKATTGRHVQTHSGERVARNTFSRPSSSDNVAIMIPSGLDSNNICSMQEIFDGLVARTFCAPSDCGMSITSSVGCSKRNSCLSSWVGDCHCIVERICIRIWRSAKYSSFRLCSRYGGCSPRT